MTIRIQCRCGKKFQLLRMPKSSIQCPSCSSEIRNLRRAPRRETVAAQVDSDVEPLPGDFGSEELDQLLATEHTGDGFSADVADEQRAVSGPIADRPFSCPGCESLQQNRAAKKCTACDMSFRKGHCANCGSKMPSRNRCKCSMRPVVWGKCADALCTQCGVTIKRPGFWQRSLLSKNPAEFACPRCGVDRFLRGLDDVPDNSLRGFDQMFGITRRAETNEFGYRTDSQRLRQLNRELESLESALDKLLDRSVDNGGGGGFLSLFGKTVLGGALFGEFGEAMAMASHNSSSVTVGDEDSEKLENLMEKISRGTELQKRMKSFIRSH
jgi:hypothetical protein